MPHAKPNTEKPCLQDFPYSLKPYNKPEALGWRWAEMRAALINKVTLFNKEFLLSSFTSLVLHALCPGFLFIMPWTGKSHVCEHLQRESRHGFFFPQCPDMACHLTESSPFFWTESWWKGFSHMEKKWFAFSSILRVPLFLPSYLWLTLFSFFSWHEN